MFNKITLGPITVYMYGLMIAIGFASALFLCNYRGKKRGLSEDTIFGIFLCALIGGMVGCRLLILVNILRLHAGLTRHVVRFQALHQFLSGKLRDRAV